jgi:hypothetical protein
MAVRSVRYSRSRGGVCRLGELPYIQRLSKGEETGDGGGGREMHGARKRAEDAGMEDRERIVLTYQ